MKAIKLVLKNFANIFTGMGLTEIVLDLSKCENIITLLAGPNGSGKTTILSSIHPFAYPGNMDIRNDGDIILENKDGFKEIVIDDDGDIFDIKHIYSRTSNSKTVKSFINKNGNELNVNGNVTSFKEIVKTELGVEQDFLKLLRLGTNVTNLINMKYTERKKYSSQLLSDIDIYTILFKKINDTTRNTKAVMKNTADKITRLNINDINGTKLDLKRLKDDKDRMSNHKDNILIKIGSLKDAIKNISDKDIDELHQLRDSTKNEISYKEKEIQKIQKEKNILDKFNKDNDLDKLRMKLDKTNIQLAIHETNIENTLTSLNILQEDKRSKEEKLKYVDTDSNIDDMKQFKTDLMVDIQKIENSLPDVKYKNISKEEAIILINTMNEFIEIMDEIHTTNHKGELDTFYKYLNGNIDSIVNKKLKIIEERMLTINMELNVDEDSKGKNQLMVLYQVCDNNECPFIKYYNDTSKKVISNKTELRNHLNKLDSDKTFWLNVLTIHKLFSHIKYILNHNDQILIKSQIHIIINSKSIIKMLLQNSYDSIDLTKTALTNYIRYTESLDEIYELKNKVKDIDMSIQVLKNQNYSLEILRDDINKTMEDISSQTQKLSTLKSEKEALLSNKDNYTKSIDNILRYNEICSQLDVCKNDITCKYDEYNTLIHKIQNLKEIVSKLQNINNELSFINKEISNVTNSLNMLERRIIEYESLNNDLKELEFKYDECETIRRALSSSKGIPLLYIQIYMRSTKKMINDLLDIVYHGSLRVETFVINENEFRIPYTKNGVTVKDIAYASQGEVAIINLAMSLAFSEKTIDRYNILLLDEVDAALDSSSRLAFIEILERFFDKIKCEQAFITSHNNAFDNYGIDMILTGRDENIDNFKKINVVFKR